MFTKKNKIVPLNKPVDEYKFKKLKRVDECEKLHNFFKSQVKVEMADRTYVTNFYVYPAPPKNQCCNIL